MVLKNKKRRTNEDCYILVYTWKAASIYSFSFTVVIHWIFDLSHTQTHTSKLDATRTFVLHLECLFLFVFSKACGGSVMLKEHEGCCSPLAKLCLTLCDPMDDSVQGFPVLHSLPEFVQTHVHGVGDVIQPSHPLSPSSFFFSFSLKAVRLMLALLLSD